MTGSGLRPETRQKPDAPAACPTPRRPGKAFPPVPALSGGRFVRERDAERARVGLEHAGAEFKRAAAPLVRELNAIEEKAVLEYQRQNELELTLRQKQKSFDGLKMR